MTGGVTADEKDIGRQMWDLLERKPEKYDVVFSVGVTKVKVQAVKLILEAASPVFEAEFEEKWDTAVVKDGEGIPLVDVDPFAFQLFVKLIILDTWSAEVLKALDLRPNTLLNLLSICHRFQVTKAIKNLEAAADEFIRFVKDFVDLFTLYGYYDTDEFLELSQSNLATIVSSEELPLAEIDIFDSVCRWAEFKCTQKKMENTGENILCILGTVFFDVRFPTMSVMDFSKVCRHQWKLLSDPEIVAVYNFIGMDDQEKQKYDGSQLPFKTHTRKEQRRKTKFEGSALCLTKNQKIGDSPPFVCDGKEKYNMLQISNGRIALHGIGFFGPIDENSHFEVTVQITRQINGYLAYDSGKRKKRIFARKQQIFYFTFDELIAIEPVDDDPDFDYEDYYDVLFWLKGPNTMAVRRIEGEQKLEQPGVQFRFYGKSGRHQVAELLYKKL